MKKVTKYIELKMEGIAGKGYLGKVDSKYKMGVKPIVTFAKQLTSCLHRGKFNPQVLRAQRCLSQ